MKKLVFALAGALVLGACSSGGDDAGDNSLNAAATENLDQSAGEAANAADAEAAALGDQLNQLENTPATNEAEASASDEQEQNVAGM
jgi:hypothetical protein